VMNPSKRKLELNRPGGAGHSLLEPDLPEQIDRSSSATSQRTNHQRPHRPAQLLQLHLDPLNHLALILERLQSSQPSLPIRLGSHSQASRRRSRKSGMEPERGDPSARGVGEELEVVQGSSSESEPTEDVGPAALVLVAVRELDVRVGEGSLGLLELLESDDGRRLGAVGGPRVVRDELAANARAGEVKG
jgi:hypothetical protein